MYVVVEGEQTEVQVYRSWIPLVNPALREAPDLFSMTTNNFSILCGYGYPGYLDVIEAAIQDVNSSAVADRLVIAVDTEDLTMEEKSAEIDELLRAVPCIAEVVVVLQHPCIEAWALGNRKVNPRQPKSEALREYRRVHDVRLLDPELIPAHQSWNRAQFSERYLRTVLNDRNKRLTYQKNNPKAICHPKYFAQLQARAAETGHIGTFREFVRAFS